jgi:MFS family permease
LFDDGYLLVEDGQLLPFAAGSLLAFPCLAWLIKLFRQSSLQQTRLYQFWVNIEAGVLVAGFFFAVYFIFATIFNQTAFNKDDIFFDSDGLLWRSRFTTEAYSDYYWRPVHPLVLITIRPLVFAISIFLKGDTLAAAFVLVAFVGALCVFLVWYFVKHTVGNSLYALMIASILGASAGHLVFGSLLETYIFLAATMLVFLVLLLSDRPLPALVITGLVLFGITISNFAQTVIAFIFVKRDFWQWVKYGLIVASLTIPLTLFNNLIYPKAQPYFFYLSSYGEERPSIFKPTVERGVALGKIMFLHSIVAPYPIFTTDVKIPFLLVRDFIQDRKTNRIQLSEYEANFDTTTVLVWVVLAAIGGFLFLKNFRKSDNRFSLALMLILLFNFVLHLKYGKDPFLYAMNWTYAIVLILAQAWREVANKRWFQISLLTFIALLLANNSRLLFTMLSASALHFR